MVDFRVVPVEVGVAAITTWAELDWPVTRDQAFAVRDQLGWTALADERTYTTNWGLGPETGSLIAEPDLTQVAFGLSTLAPEGTEDEVSERSWAAFDAYVAALTARYGRPTRSKGRFTIAADWKLPSGASVGVAGSDRLLQADIYSPSFNKAGEWETWGMEQGLVD